MLEQCCLVQPVYVCFLFCFLNRRGKKCEYLLILPRQLGNFFSFLICNCLRICYICVLKHAGSTYFSSSSHRPDVQSCIPATPDNNTQCQAQVQPGLNPVSNASRWVSGWELLSHFCTLPSFAWATCFTKWGPAENLALSSTLVCQMSGYGFPKTIGMPCFPIPCCCFHPSQVSVCCLF